MPAFVTPAYCKATQTDGNKTLHRCNRTGPHTKHVCTATCQYAWEGNAPGRKPERKQS